ncbi:MAG: HEAT repeat domain-containing protein [Pirellulaceae bacterium]
MFGWFQPQCPLDTAEKAWVELRMNWLLAKLGQQRLIDATVMLPTPEFFPDELDGREEDASKVFRRLCNHTKLDDRDILLEVRSSKEMKGALGIYIQENPPRILVNESELSDSESLVATLAHELSHHFLLGGGLLAENNLDLERLTDLLPVFLGIGLFSGNATFKESHWSDGRLSGWSMQKQGYLPGRMFAYGFSLFAFARGEQKPKWAGYLRHDLSEPFWRGLRFLNKTGDTLFGEQSTYRNLSIDQLLERLQSPSATVRYVALWELAERGRNGVAAVDQVALCLADGDLDVSDKAVRTLGKIRSAAAISALKGCLYSVAPRLRAAAAQTLGEIGVDRESVIPELRGLLRDSEDTVRSAATQAIDCFGKATFEQPSPLYLP